MEEAGYLRQRASLEESYRALIVAMPAGPFRSLIEYESKKTGVDSTFNTGNKSTRCFR